MIKANPSGDCPNIHSSSYVDETAVLIGNVKIGENVFIGPGAIIRADEKNSEIVIKDCCNVQDRVIIHCLEETKVIVHANTSLAHGCIIHGPSEIGDNSFIGFNSVVFGATLGEGVIVKHQCCVEGVTIPSSRMIESGQILKYQNETNDLKNVNYESTQFAEKVVNVNLDLVKGYATNAL